MLNRIFLHKLKKIVILLNFNNVVHIIFVTFVQNIVVYIQTTHNWLNSIPVICDHEICKEHETLACLKKRK